MTDMDKYRVTLAEEERADLEQLVSRGRAAARKLTHARILQLADDSLGEEPADEQIVAALGTSLRTVSRVRQQLVTEGLDVALRRRRQPPRPDRIKIEGDVEQRRIRLACSDPPQGCRHWTLQLRADQLVVLGLVKKVSTETVRQVLKKTASNPGLSSPGVSHPRRTPTTSGAWRT
jgi:DNA-binding transcriptional LysR family regulator